MKLKFLASVFFILGFTFWPLTVAHADPNGLKVEVYTFDPSALPDRQPYELCQTSVVSVANMNFDVGGDVVAECQADYVLIHYSGYLTLDRTGLVSIQSWADDGFYLTLDGVTIIDDWTLKGCSGSSALIGATAGVSMKLDAWWYEYGGGACNILWVDGQPIPDSAFTQDVVDPPTPDVPTLEAPTFLQAENSVDGVKLSWLWQAGETPVERFAVSWTYGDNPGWGIATLINEATITGLPEDTDVTFWVRSDNDSLAVYSPISEKITIHTPKTEIVVPIDPVDPVIDPVTPVEPSPEPEPIPDPQPTLEPVVEPVEPELPILSPQEQHEALMTELMLEAEADDIVVPEEIADIPFIGDTAVAVINALNFVGNVGADMTPAVRKQAKQTLVSAVIVTQIAQLSTQTAMSAASASVSSGSPKQRKID